MNSDRIKEIQQKTACPESISVNQALLQVWNECEQENEAVAFGDWLRRQRPDVFYGSPTTKQLFENFKNNNMTPKKEAQNLVDEFRFIIQDEDTDCGNEILCTIIAKKCAKVAVKKILLANPTWFVDPLQSTHKYWEEVLKEIEKI